MRTLLAPRPLAGSFVAVLLVALLAGSPVVGAVADPATASPSASPTADGRGKPLTYVGQTPQLRGSGHAGTRLRVTLIKTRDFEPTAQRLTYVWTRRGEVIPGATGRFYTLTDDDRARKVRAIVTGERAGWTSRRVRTNVVKVVR